MNYVTNVVRAVSARRYVLEGMELKQACAAYVWRRGMKELCTVPGSTEVYTEYRWAIHQRLLYHVQESMCQ